MKTKFSAIVHLRKRDMQECERAIMQNENKIASKRMQIDDIADELVGLKVPQSGAFQAFMAYEELKKMLLFRMGIAQQELEELHTNKMLLQEQYKKCHIEYEKMASLEKREQESMFKNLKLKEKKEVDEIATMLYSNTEGRFI